MTTNFAVVDLETTGGHAAKHKIIEIGIVIYEDGKFKEQYQTYVNPQAQIPFFITTLTGINQEDVEDAPVFPEVAEKVADMLKDRIFVAQNVNFDYSFLKKEFEMIGMPFVHQRLCTSRYARSSINGLKRSGLKVLAEYFNITNERPHRALSDALTAAEILDKLLAMDENHEIAKKLINKKQSKVTLPTRVDPEDYNSLPSRPGVYFFLGEDKKPIYIGKAINIKKRVSSHFNGDLTSSKLQSFLRDIYKIEFKETGSDLLAYLYEDMMIRKHWPIYNKAQKHNTKKFGVISYQDQKGNWRLAVNPIKQATSALKWFHYYSSAMQWVHDITVEYELNPNYTGILSLVTPEVVSDIKHAENFQMLLNSDVFKEETIYWKEKGRTANEESIIVSQGFRIKGYCFVNKMDQLPSLDELENNMESLISTGTTEKIIENYLQKNKPALLVL